MDKEPLKIKLKLAIKNLNDIYKLAVDDNAIQKIVMSTIMLLEDCESDIDETTTEQVAYVNIMQKGDWHSSW